MKSRTFRVEVQTKDSDRWYTNPVITFHTREQAEAYAKRLTENWDELKEWRIVEVFVESKAQE